MKKFILSVSVVTFLFLVGCTGKSVEPMQVPVMSESLSAATTKSEGEAQSEAKKPLFIIMRNGKKLEMQIEDIQTDEIASVSVIKNPKSLIPYGPKAKDGVIIITLKD